MLHHHLVMTAFHVAAVFHILHAGSALHSTFTHHAAIGTTFSMTHHALRSTFSTHHTAIAMTTHALHTPSFAPFRRRTPSAPAGHTPDSSCACANKHPNGNNNNEVGNP